MERDRAGAGRPAGNRTAGPVLGRIERFGRVGSTNDIVRDWLAAGEPEVCAAIADEQRSGRGRLGRSWTAPPGAALLCTVGFRPRWLPPDRAWRLPATVALAIADAAEEVAGLPEGSIRLKWPNDLVIEIAGPNALLLGELSAVAAAERLRGPIELRKLGGILGESDGLGTDNPRVVVGVGVNADWPAAAFPAAIAASMTSLREASGGRPIDREALLDGFLDRLGARVESLRLGYFDLAGWTGRQATTGRTVSIAIRPPAEPGAAETVTVRALGVDAASGGLVVADPSSPTGERIVHAGEVVRVRIAVVRAASGSAGPARRTRTSSHASLGPRDPAIESGV